MPHAGSVLPGRPNDRAPPPPGLKQTRLRTGLSPNTNPSVGQEGHRALTRAGRVLTCVLLLLCSAPCRTRGVKPGRPSGSVTGRL